MTREALIQKTLQHLAKLPDQKIKEVSDFAEFLLSKIDNQILTEGIQKMVSESKSFDFLEEDEEIYFVEDLKEKYKWKKAICCAQFENDTQTMIQLILLFGLLLGTDNQDHDIPGTYVRRIHKHSDVRQFGRTLTLNCDYTVAATFQGDMMNEKVKGKWRLKGDTVVVTIDEPLGHWNKENLFVIHKRQLKLIVTEIKAEKITDERLKEALFKDSKKYAYDKTKKQDCE